MSLSLCLSFFRHMVPVTYGVSGLSLSHPGLGVGGPTKPSDQRGSPFRMAARNNGHVH